MSMRCRDVEPLLSAWLDRSLNGAQQAAVVAHLSSCDRCSADAASLQRTVTLLRAVPVRALPPDVRSALLSSALAAVLEPGPRPGRSVPRALVATLALLGALGGWAWGLGRQEPAPVVSVPIDQYVTEHLQGTGTRAPAPVLVEARD
jgi:anti-sigma factor RsiW